jgi:hypothetical protein
MQHLFLLLAKPTAGNPAQHGSLFNVQLIVCTSVLIGRIVQHSLFFILYSKLITQNSPLNPILQLI